MSPRASSLRLLGALLVAGAVCAVPAVAKLDDPDTTAPVITVTFPADGQEITSDQGALPTQFDCVDPVVPNAITSGKSTCEGDATIDTTKNGDQQFIVHTSDNAGNATDKIVNYKLVDRTPPTITITSPTEGMHVGLHSSHNASFSCADAGGSLIDTCQGNQNIDSPTPGPAVFTVLAIDGDGNRATKSVNYIVDPTEENVVHNSAGAEAIAEKGLAASTAALKSLRKKRKATLAFNAYAGEKITVKVTAKVKGKTVTIATASGTAGGEGIKLKLKATGAGAAALKRRGKLSLHVSVTVFDPNGNATVTKSKNVSTRR